MMKGELKEDLRVTHGEDEGLATVSGPEVVELASVPDGLEEEEWEPDGVSRWAGTLHEDDTGPVDVALEEANVALKGDRWLATLMCSAMDLRSGLGDRGSYHPSKPGRRAGRGYQKGTCEWGGLRYRSFQHREEKNC